MPIFARKLLASVTSVSQGNFKDLQDSHFKISQLVAFSANISSIG